MYFWPAELLSTGEEGEEEEKEEEEEEEEEEEDEGEDVSWRHILLCCVLCGSPGS